MSTSNNPSTKRSFKVIEIPLNKFKNEAIPHHQELFLKHKTYIHKLINTGEYDQVDKEIRDKKKIIRQLRELMYELDTLRTQVEDTDLDKFDSKTLPLRKIMLDLVSGYTGLETETRRIIEEYIDDINKNAFQQHTVQLQLQDDIEELRLQESQDRFKQINMLNNDIEDVHDIFSNLNKMTSAQREKIDTVEMNVETTNTNITTALHDLLKSAKLQKASYPIAGAFIGTLVGGPIGSVAGLKVGGLVAIGCGVAGYVSGRIFKKMNNAQILETELELEATNCEKDSDTRLSVTTANDKKDI